MSDYLEFRHGALAPSLEEQANMQGFTFGKEREIIEEMNESMILLHIHGILTDSQYDKALERFHKKYLVNTKYIKRMRGEER